MIETGTFMCWLFGHKFFTSKGCEDGTYKKIRYCERCEISIEKVCKCCNQFEPFNIFT